MIILKIIAGIITMMIFFYFSGKYSERAKENLKNFFNKK